MPTNKKKKAPSKKTHTVLTAIITIIVLAVVFCFTIPIGPKYDIEKIIRDCGYSKYNDTDSSYIQYDEKDKSMVINAQMLWIYLFSTAAKNDFNFSNPPKALCPLDELGLLDNKQFLGDFVTRLDENKNAGFTESYRGKDGKTFIITYKPDEKTTIRSDITKIDVTFNGKLYIKEKLTIF